MVRKVFLDQVMKKPTSESGGVCDSDNNFKKVPVATFRKTLYVPEKIFLLLRD